MAQNKKWERKPKLIKGYYKSFKNYSGTRTENSRSFTEEENKIYIEGLANISESTGVRLWEEDIYENKK